MDSKKIKEDIIKAGEIAVKELIKVAKEAILKADEDEIAADRLKNAAATKKLAVFDAFDILKRIEEEKDKMKTRLIQILKAMTLRRMKKTRNPS